MELNGLEWSGVSEWSGLKWNGVGWSESDAVMREPLLLSLTNHCRDGLVCRSLGRVLFHVIQKKVQVT